MLPRIHLRLVAAWVDGPVRDPAFEIFDLCPESGLSGGMAETASSFRFTAFISRLSAGLPGTTAGPLSPPASRCAFGIKLQSPLALAGGIGMAPEAVIGKQRADFRFKELLCWPCRGSRARQEYGCDAGEQPEVSRVRHHLQNPSHPGRVFVLHTTPSVSGNFLYFYCRPSGLINETISGTTSPATFIRWKWRLAER